MRTQDYTNRRLFKLPQVAEDTTHLVVSRNFLTTFSVEGQLPRLRILDLSRNRLKFFPDLSGFLELVTVDLTSNEIRKFPEILQHPSLKVLDISDNRLGPSVSLKLETRKMEILKLDKCEIRLIRNFQVQVNSGNFRCSFRDNGLLEFPKMKFPGSLGGVKVDLANNQLDRVDFTAVAQCVESLVLANNLLASFTGAFPANLQHLDVSGNRNVAISDLSPCLADNARYSLETLDVDGNDIDDVSFARLKNAFPCLEELDNFNVKCTAVNAPISPVRLREAERTSRPSESQVTPSKSEDLLESSPGLHRESSPADKGDELVKNFRRVVKLDEEPDSPAESAISESPAKERWRTSVLFVSSSSSSSEDEPTIFVTRRISDPIEIVRSFQISPVLAEELEQLDTRRMSQESLAHQVETQVIKAEETLFDVSDENDEVKVRIPADSVPEEMLVDEEPEIVETSMRKHANYVVEKPRQMVRARDRLSDSQSAEVAPNPDTSILDDLAFSGAFKRKRKVNPEKVLTLASFATNPIGCNTVDSVDRNSAEFLRVKDTVGANFRLVKVVKYVASDARDNFTRISDREGLGDVVNVFFCGADMTEKLLLGDLGSSEIIFTSPSLRESERMATLTGSLAAARDRALLCLLLPGKIFATQLSPKEVKDTLPIRDIYRKGYDCVLCSKEGVYLVLSPRCGRLLPAYLIQVERR